MSLVEKVLVLKLQDNVPNIVKILAVFTDFGDSELPYRMDSLLRAYEPIRQPSLKRLLEVKYPLLHL